MSIIYKGDKICTYLVGRHWQKLTSKQMVFAPVPEK
jgi:hypothetical protein